MSHPQVEARRARSHAGRGEPPAPRPGRSPSPAARALLRECIRLVDGGVVPWIEAIDRVADGFESSDLSRLLPRSAHGRAVLRRRYLAAATPLLRQEQIVDLRALDAALRTALIAPRRRRPWDLLDAEESRARQLPATLTGCRREILARFADPRSPIRRVHVEGAHTRGIYGFDVVRAVEQGWCITAVPRPEILAVDFDGNVSWRRILEDLCRPMEKEGGEYAIFPSGRGIETFLGDREVNKDALGVGVHVLCISPSEAAKERWARLAASMGGDVRQKSQLRVPWFVYKTKLIPACGRASEFGESMKDATEKRRLAAAFANLESLQRIAQFHRGNPRWSGVPLYSPFASKPEDDAEWRMRGRVEDGRAGRHQPLLISKESSRSFSLNSRPLGKVLVGESVTGEGDGVSNRPEHLEADVARRLSADAREILFRGDTGDRFFRLDGSGTDRSRMGLWLIWQLHFARASRRDVESLVMEQSPGLAAYWQRDDGERLFERDWMLVESARRSGRRRASVVMAAILDIPRKSFRDVALVMFAMGPRSSPGIRRLCELTGYSVRTVSLALRWLDGRVLRKVGPTRGPGSIDAQQWEVRSAPSSFLPAPQVNTSEITPIQHKRLRETVWQAIKGAVPLRALSRQDMIDASEGMGWPALRKRMGHSLRRHVDWVLAAQLRHEAQRAEYRKRLERAAERGVPFVSPIEARRRRVRYFSERLRSAGLEGEFRDLRRRAARSIRGTLPLEITSIKSPNERLREMHLEWIAEQRVRDGYVEPWLERMVA